MKHGGPLTSRTKATLAINLNAALGLLPKTVNQLARVSGLSEREIRRGIDFLRANEVAVWWSPRGFWADGRSSPCPPNGVAGGSTRWKKEPPVSLLAALAAD